MATLEQLSKKDQSGGRELDWFVDTFRSSESWLQNQRSLSRRDYAWVDNFDDDQWDRGEKKLLRDRHQPVVTSNRLASKVGFLMGLEQRARTDPKAFPRNPEDEDAARIATDVLNYIETNIRFDNLASNSFRDLLIGGTEAVEIVINDKGDLDATFISHDSFFFDPRSKKGDFSDASYMGYSVWHDLKAAEAFYPAKEQKQLLQDTLDLAPTANGIGEDKPVHMFGDKLRRRVRVIVMYYKLGLEWRFVHFTGSGVLIEGPSFYHDEDGRPANAIIAQSATVTQENERLGVVRNMISPQREINYHKSKAAHSAANQRFWTMEGAIVDIEDAKQQLSRADGALVVNGPAGQTWGMIDSTAEISVLSVFLQEAKAELAELGPTAALQGRGTENQSGIAIQAQQQSGIVEQSNVITNHTDWKLRCYRTFWARVKQFWTEEKWIRVTDDENSFRFAQVNILATPANQIKQLPEEVQEEALARLGVQSLGDPRLHIPEFEIVQDPETGQAVQRPKLINALAEMDMDIIIEAVPDNLTMRSEQFNQLVTLAGTGVQIPARLWIMMSELSNKGDLLEALDQEQQRGAEGQQQLIEVENAKTSAEIENKQADTGKKVSEIALNEAKTTNTNADTAETMIPLASAGVSV